VIYGHSDSQRRRALCLSCRPERPAAGDHPFRSRTPLCRTDREHPQYDGHARKKRVRSPWKGVRQEGLLEQRGETYKAARRGAVISCPLTPSHRSPPLHPPTSPAMLPLTFALAALPLAVLAGKTPAPRSSAWTLTKEAVRRALPSVERHSADLMILQKGAGFFSDWDFFSLDDPTEGTVDYVLRDVAFSEGLVVRRRSAASRVLAPADTSTSRPTRPSRPTAGLS
jgi:hypothetical protein